MKNARLLLIFPMLIFLGGCFAAAVFPSPFDVALFTEGLPFSLAALDSTLKLKVMPHIVRAFICIRCQHIHQMTVTKVTLKRP